MKTSGIIGTAFVSFCSISVPALAAALPYEDVDHALEALPAHCRPCARFYRVDRPLVDGVLDHSYVSARYTATCGGVKSQIGDVEYGLSKGAVDHAYFVEVVRSPEDSYGLREFVAVCGDDLLAAHAAAFDETADWRQREADGLFYLWDMVTAPIGGRPCGNAADAVEAAIYEAL